MHRQVGSGGHGVCADPKAAGPGVLPEGFEVQLGQGSRAAPSRRRATSCPVTMAGTPLLSKALGSKFLSRTQTTELFVGGGFFCLFFL